MQRTDRGSLTFENFFSGCTDQLEDVQKVVPKHMQSLFRTHGRSIRRTDRRFLTYVFLTDGQTMQRTDKGSLAYVFLFRTDGRTDERTMQRTDRVFLTYVFFCSGRTDEQTGEQCDIQVEVS